MFEKLAPQLHSSTKRVAARSNIIKHLRFQLDNEKEKCLKDNDNKENPNLRMTEKEGFVFKQNSIKEWLLRYLLLRDETLFTVKRSKKSGGKYDYNDAKYFCNVFLAKIRKSDEYPDLPIFEIISVKDNKTFYIMVENVREMEEWINVLNLKVQHLIEKQNKPKIPRLYSADSKNVSDKSTFLGNDTEVINYENEEKISEAERKIDEEVKELIGANI